MIKEREPAIERIGVTFQVVLTLVCYYFVLWISGYFSDNVTIRNNDHLIITFIIVPIWYMLLDFFELGAMARIQRYRHLIKKYAYVVFLGTLTLFFIIELLEYDSFTPNIILKFAILNFLLLTTLKIASRTIIKYFRRQGFNSRMILLIADESSVPFIKQIIEMDDWGYRIWGIITNSNRVKEEFGDAYTIYSESENFSKIIDEKIIDEVFYCKQDFHMNDINRLIAQCREIGVSFHIHNKVLSFHGQQPSISFLNHQFFLSFGNTPSDYVALKIKSAIDYLLTILILILISPVMFAISILIKMEDGGPVFFKQIRVGRHGRLFKCYKFRTMVVNAEELKEKLMSLNEQEGPVFKIKNDPRITKVGRFLRKTSLDELPQFFNVLLGDMSIVGPRPPIPSEVEQYDRSLHRRLSITPGITCTWQVSGRNNIPFDKWMEMDMEYIDNWSLSLDLMIILKTFKVLISGNGQ